MPQVLDRVENAVWHAFDFLALDSGGTARKSKLKVLTASLGHILEVPGSENGLDDYRSTDSLTFDEYRFYLNKEVFAALPDKMSLEEQLGLEEKMENVCWLICKQPYTERGSPMLSENCVKQIWRIFCMLGELIIEEETGNLEVIMAAREVELVFQQFLSCLGTGQTWDPEQFDQVVSVMPVFKFSIFLAVLESKYAKDIDSLTLAEAVKDLKDYFLLDVIKKGKLRKRLEIFPKFRECWVVVQPHKLSVYGGSAEDNLKGEISLNQQSRVEKVTQSNTFIPIKNAKHRFVLHCDNKQYEFQAYDHRSRLQWISAIEKAIDFSFQGSRFQRALAEERRVQRDEEVGRRVSNQDLVQQTRMELEAEKAARLQAESRALMLTQEKATEVKRMNELEVIREELERLLEEEKQAKRDEEIVRTLQARMLNEEWERREQLEKIQAEQKMMLEEERNKREEFQSMKEDRERKAQEAEKRLKEMEEERMRLDEELKKHKERSRRVFVGQEVLGAKIKVREQECELKKEFCPRISSFHPSTLSVTQEEGSANGLTEADRPRYRPLRSASMRETSYSRSIRRRIRTDGKPVNSVLHSEEVNNNNNSSD